VSVCLPIEAVSDDSDEDGSESDDSVKPRSVSKFNGFDDSSGNDASGRENQQFTGAEMKFNFKKNESVAAENMFDDVMEEDFKSAADKDKPIDDDSESDEVKYLKTSNGLTLWK
jgi:hypothetical protein